MAYLDQIAPKDTAKASFFSGKMLFVIIGAVLVLAIVVIIAIANGGNSAPSGEQLGARMTKLQELIKYGQDNGIESAPTNKVLAEATAIVTSRKVDLAKIYDSGKKGSFSKPSKETVAAESDATLINDLDSDKNLNKLTASYIKALRDKFASTEELVQKMYDKTKSKSAREALEKTYKDLDELRNRLPDEETGT